MAITLIAIPYPDARLEQYNVGANIPDYLIFIRQMMGIPAEALPDDAIIIDQSFWFAMTVVNQYLVVVGNMEPTPQQFPTYHAYAVYNLAGHFLVYHAIDDADLEPPWNTYFKDLRQKFGLNSFTPGIIQSTSDQGTSQSFMIPSWMSDMTLSEMEMLKTPWGRAYMSLAQAYGPTIWGLTR